MNNAIVRFAVLFLVVLLFSHSVYAGDRTIDIGGRQVDVFSPDGMEKRMSPLILFLHGGGGSSGKFRNSIDFTDIARQKRFHIAYLNGTPTMRDLSNVGSLGQTWNAGSCCNDPANKTVDDVAYIDSVITYFVKQGIADPRYVYLLGHSNGALMAYRYACERGSRLYGIIPIAGAIVTEAPCDKMGGVKVLHIHGEDDESVPIKGGMPQNPDTPALWRLTAPYPTINETKRMALKGGASTVDLKIIKNAAHEVEDISFQLKKKTGYDIPSLVFMYFNDGIDRFPK